MTANSLQTLLTRMRKGSVTLGWGAVVALGRAQLNRLLQEQYLEWLHEGRAIPPISGVVLTDKRTERMELKGLVLGKPVLSFKSAILNQSFVTVRMNIVAGNYTSISQPSSIDAHRLLSSFSITEGMGYYIEMKVNLNQITGEVDNRGRVTFDLASDPNMTCNLGTLPGVTKNVAAFIQGYLSALPNEMRTFELGLLDFSSYNPLSPIGFHIRTQKAPGSESEDDGAVLVFVRLKIHDENGTLPVEGSDFPYFIPDDRSAGKALYSASIVLNKDWIELLDEVQLDVLKNLLLPGDNRFIESPEGRHTPHDLLVLGNLEPDADNLTIEPSIINLKAGGTQTFTAIARDGTAARVQWSVSNPVSPLVTGSITAEGGKYTMPAPALMGKEQQSIVVTAQFAGQGGLTQESSALVHGMFEGMSISPRVSNSSVGPGAATIELRADSLGGGTLQWPTLLPSEGSLRVVDNNHAIYTPPVEQAQPIAIQTIRVTNSLTKETIDAAIVLIKSAHTLPVDPPFVAAVDATTPIQLYADTDDPQDLRWTVIGEGSVDENGIFTPPAQPASRATVVRCSYIVGGVVRYSGLSVIQLSQLSMPDPSWLGLQEFSIVASGQDQCFSNGFQQIPVIIKIETKPVNIGGQDVYIPVSDAHLSTLRLVDKLSNAPVPFIEVGQEGIEYQSGVNWAVSKKRNRFSLYSASNRPASAVALPTPQNNGVRYRELWIHLAAEGSRTFYAQFTSDQGTHNSNDSPEEGFEVTVRGIRPASPPLNHYELKRQRAWQDKDGIDGPPLDGESAKDYFSYYRQSIDYWRLSYHRLGMYPVLFVDAKVEENISTIQWESELVDEEYFSYTGYAFNPANNEFSDSLSPEGLSFDPYLWGLARLHSIELQSSFITNMEPASGELMISLHRTDNMKYWYDALADGDKRRLYRQHLDKHVKVVLLDQDGNRHALKFGFESPSIQNSRNKVLLSRF